MKAYAYFAMFLVLGLTIAWALDCKHCKKTIRSNYIQDSKGNAYCNSTCAKATLPACQQCKKKVSGKYLRHNSKIYCSKTCFNKILPACKLCNQKSTGWTRIRNQEFCTNCAKLNRCTECQYPFNKGIRLSDKRYVCSRCSPTLIKDEISAKAHYLKAREIVKTITGKQSSAVPALKLLDYQTLQKQANSKGLIRGYYHRTELHTTLKKNGHEVNQKELKQKTIYLLTHMTERNFSSTAVHEFTHDIIAVYYPHVKKGPEWAHEGLCQYVAHIYCRAMDWQQQIIDIEKSPNPIYGDGFRFFKLKFGNDNWKDVEAWVKKTNFTKLPAKAPGSK